MSLTLIVTIGFVMFFGFLWESRQRYARSRAMLTARMKKLAVVGRAEIGGRPIEHWLRILNDCSSQGLIAAESIVFFYKGQELFFASGTLGCLTPLTNKWGYTTKGLCFVVAVGEAAVTLLSEHGNEFRLITGSAELAAFSIFRLSAFAALIGKEMGDRRRERARKPS
jgi:hypothetical protein